MVISVVASTSVPFVGVDTTLDSLIAVAAGPESSLLLSFCSFIKDIGYIRCIKFLQISDFIIV